MTTKGYIEVLDRSGKVILQKPVKKDGIRLGRAYDNDIILDDPFVCPHHLRLAFVDDNLMAEDLGSINGTRYGRERRRQKSVNMSNGDNLRVGRTSLRYRPTDFHLPATRVAPSQFSFIRLFKHPIFPLAAFFTAMAVMLLHVHLETAKEFDGRILGFTLILFLSFLLTWSASWAFASKLVSQRWNFVVHCGIACTGIVAFACFSTLLDYFCFAFGLDIVGPVFSYILFGLLCMAWIFLHLSYSSNARPRKHLKAASGVALVLVSLLVVTGYLVQDQFSGSPRYEVTLKHPYFQMTRGTNPQDFFHAVKSMKEELRANCEVDE